ncbi:MAG: sulfatase-like hydrolase/transferase [Polyangia bacterium]
MDHRAIIIFGLIVAVAIATGCGSGEERKPTGAEPEKKAEQNEKAEQPSEPEPEPPVPSGPNVVFFVLDTLRSDHTSLCGYERPTTPNLAALAEREGAKQTCGAVAPASWTLPSHASFFTATDPVEHGAHSYTKGVKNLEGWGSATHNLGADLPTLAEKMAERGYQTVAISSNPLISESLGLVRGFSKTAISKKWGDMFGDAFIPAVKRAMEGVSRERPLFLFVNISDAHQPWPAVPEGLDWVPARPANKYKKNLPDSDWRRYIEGKMKGKERAGFLERIRDQYDHACFVADRNFGRSLSFLQHGGWCDDDCRVVVVSDHGEFLGEHGLLDHGHYVWEEMVRVPLVTWGAADDLELPEVINAVHSFHLALDGRLPEKPEPVASMSWPHVRRCAHTANDAFCSTQAALWYGTEKLLYSDGKLFRIDLERDPGEKRPARLKKKHPHRAELEQLSGRVVADDWEKRNKAADGGTGDEIEEKLRALGYLD